MVIVLPPLTNFPVDTNILFLKTATCDTLFKWPDVVTPWRGRSALDAVELMDIGWNFRREHLRPEHRSHYVITHGGDQPNVVPPEASVWYFFREWDYEKIRDLHAIGTKIANAAAINTSNPCGKYEFGWNGRGRRAWLSVK